MLCTLTVTKTTNAFLHTENSSMTDMFWRCTGGSYKRKHALWNESKKLGCYDYASFIFHEKENGHARRGCSSILCEKGYFYIHLSRDFQERTTTVFLQDKSFGCAWDATKRVSVLWHTFAHLLMGAIEQARILDRVMDNKSHWYLGI